MFARHHGQPPTLQQCAPRRPSIRRLYIVGRSGRPSSFCRMTSGPRPIDRGARGDIKISKNSGEELLSLERRSVYLNDRESLDRLQVKKLASILCRPGGRRRERAAVQVCATAVRHARVDASSTGIDELLAALLYEGRYNYTGAIVERRRRRRRRNGTSEQLLTSSCVKKG